MKFLMHLSEILASSKIWIGLCGGSLIILPIMGIMIVHSSPQRHEPKQGRDGSDSNSEVSQKV